MIVPWLTFIAVGLITYAAFLKLAARLLRYSVLWKSGFHFAGIMLIIVVLGGWFFRERGANRRGAVLGWGGGMRLVALAFAIGVVVAFAIAVPVQVFLKQHLSTSP